MVQIPDGYLQTMQLCFRNGLVRRDPHVYKEGHSLSSLMCTGCVLGDAEPLW